MATATKGLTVGGYIVMSPEHERYYEILDMLELKVPDDLDLLEELSGLVCDLMSQSERKGVERHAAQILQMIEGSRYQVEDSMPPFVETPGDEDRSYRMVEREVSA